MRARPSSGGRQVRGRAAVVREVAGRVRGGTLAQYWMADRRKDVERHHRGHDQRAEHHNREWLLDLPQECQTSSGASPGAGKHRPLNLFTFDTQIATTLADHIDAGDGLIAGNP